MIEVEELRDAARGEACLLFDAWHPPTASWPTGTLIEPRRNGYIDWPADRSDGRPDFGPYSSRYHMITLPNGGRLITLTQDRDGREHAGEPWLDGKAPHVLYSAVVNEADGTVYACPRVCNMEFRLGAQRDYANDDDDGRWMVDAIGLERRYRIGRLSRPLRKRTRVVDDGWGY